MTLTWKFYRNFGGRRYRLWVEDCKTKAEAEKIAKSLRNGTTLARVFGPVTKISHTRARGDQYRVDRERVWYVYVANKTHAKQPHYNVRR